MKCLGTLFLPLVPFRTVHSTGSMGDPESVTPRAAGCMPIVRQCTENRFADRRYQTAGEHNILSEATDGFGKITREVLR